MRDVTTTGAAETYTKIPIRASGIAWKKQKDNKYKKFEDGGNQWSDVTNERFINWMQAPLRSNFYKLWGVIDQDLEKGLYRFDITNGNFLLYLQTSLSVI